MDYNWNKMDDKLNKCSIMWIKWCRSEIISVKLIKRLITEIKRILGLKKISRDVGVDVKRILNECKWD